MTGIDFILEAINSDLMDTALDLIVEYGMDLTASDANAVMDAAAKIDPTFSGIGAEIRDTLRDNSNLTIN